MGVDGVGGGAGVGGRGGRGALNSSVNNPHAYFTTFSLTELLKSIPFLCFA